MAWKKSQDYLLIIQNSGFIYDLFDTAFTSVVSIPEALKEIEKQLNVHFQLEPWLITSVLHGLCCVVSNMAMSFNWVTFAKQSYFCKILPRNRHWVI